MQFVLLVYTDADIAARVPADQYNSDMRECLAHADTLQAEGRLLDYQQLEAAQSAKSVRVRAGRTSVVDGPFAETKEMLAGFNLVEAESMDEAVRMAQALPWTAYGCVEVRQVKDIGGVRRQVGAPAAG
jgi:hypothetical protein